MAYYIASCSCGNDSMAMVQELVRRGYPLDEIVFYSNGMDFQAIYRLWKWVKQTYEPMGIKCTMLTPKNDFLYDMLDRPKTKRTGEQVCGDGWCGGACRWGTFEKIAILNKYAKDRNAKVYVGFACDEETRIANLEDFKIAPLADWGMTQNDCLQYNRDNGINWNEETEQTDCGHIDLYTILDRVSCWCCSNKNQWELYNIWKYLPVYWDKLKDLQSKICKPFKTGEYGYTIFEIEERFVNGYVPKHRTKKL